MIADTDSSPADKRLSATQRILLGLLVAAVAIAVGSLLSVSPLLAIAAAAVAVLGLVVVKSPDLATFAVIFILYSNVAVVAWHFHGVPRVIASAFPLLLLVPLTRDIILRKQGLIATPALPFLGLFLVVQVIGLLFSRNVDVSRTVVVEFVMEGLLVYILITNAVRTPRALRLAVWALLLAGLVSAVVPIYQQATGSFRNNYGGFGQTTEVGFRTGEVTSQGEVRQIRLAGPIGEQNRYAQNMLVLLPLGLFLFLGERSKRRRRVILLLTALIGVGFLLAFSRGGAVAFVILFATTVLMRLIPTRFVLLLVLAVVVSLVAMPQYWTRLMTFRDIPRVFSSSGRKQADSAIRGRITEMAAAALVFADHPVVGVGPGMFKYYSAEYGNRIGIRRLEGTRKAHSLYLEVAAETGVLGLFCFAGMIFATMYGLILARRRLLNSPVVENVELAHLATGFLLALVAYLAAALFLHLAYIRFFYLILALAGAAARIVNAQPTMQLPTRVGANSAVRE